MTTKTINRIMAVSLLMAGLLAFAQRDAGAASFTDVVGRTAVTSFNAMLEALPEKAVADESNGMWVLTAPDKSATLAWRADHRESRLYDVMFEFDARPFVDAGLDTNKLPIEMVSEDKIVIGSKLTGKTLSYDGEITPLASFEQIVKTDRDRIGYHAELDHYGLSLLNGNVFEWAKDMNKNDKDIVFALNPQPFIDAGVDPAKVEGWVFGKVLIEDAKGKKIKVDKFLKPFDLK